MDACMHACMEIDAMPCAYRHTYITLLYIYIYIYIYVYITYIHINIYIYRYAIYLHQLHPWELIHRRQVRKCVR